MVLHGARQACCEKPKWLWLLHLRGKKKILRGRVCVYVGNVCIIEKIFVTLYAFSRRALEGVREEERLDAAVYASIRAK